MLDEIAKNEGLIDYWIDREFDNICNQKDFKCEITNYKQAKVYINKSLKLIKDPKSKENPNITCFYNEIKGLKHMLKSERRQYLYERVYIMYLLINKIKKEKES